MSAAAGKMLAAVEELGFVGVLQAGEHDAVALRYRRPEHGGVWGVAVWRGETLIFCWVVTPGGFVEKGAESLLPFLAGPAAQAQYEARRAETNARAAATRALTAELKAALLPRLAEMMAAEPPVPREWLAGGLTCDGKRVARFVDAIDKGRNDHAGRDRAAG